MNNNYDVIIYGASIPGILRAVAEQHRNRKILLLNRYGFPGGRITECLDLIVKKRNPSDSLADNILSLIIKTRGGTLQETDNYYVLNPEVVKYVLQKYLTSNSIEMLFHITPASIDTEDELTLTVIAKEGLIKLATKKLIDGSYNNQLNFLGSGRKTKFATMNIITNKLTNDQVQFPIDTTNKIILNDGRSFLTLKLNTNSDISDSFHLTGESINRELIKNGSRVQLLPPEPYLIYEKNDNIDRNFVEQLYDSSETLNMDDFEIAIKQESGFNEKRYFQRFTR